MDSGNSETKNSPLRHAFPSFRFRHPTWALSPQGPSWEFQVSTLLWQHSGQNLSRYTWTLYHPLGLALWQSTPLTYSKRKVPLLSGAHQQCVKCMTGYSTVSTGYQWILSSRELTFVSFNYLKPNLWSMPSWNLQFDRGTYMNQEQWGWYP